MIRRVPLSALRPLWLGLALLAAVGMFAGYVAWQEAAIKAVAPWYA
jgi:hypothetical protein